MKTSSDVCINGHVGRWNAHGHCKDCANESQKRARAANPEKFKARDKARYAGPRREENLAKARESHQRNREKNLQRMRERYHQDIEKSRANNRIRHKRNYKTVRWRHKYGGLPLPTRPEPKICECCGKSPKNGRTLHLDHDHASGKFRGWLCMKCNTGIGKLGDSMEGLLLAVSYLSR